jgi:hypothetical protein
LFASNGDDVEKLDAWTAEKAGAGFGFSLAPAVGADHNNTLAERICRK